LIKEFEFYADVEGDFVRPGPFGVRVIGNVTGGQIVGDRLKGEIMGASGDWLLVGLDGFARPDVRLTFETVDEALIYVQFFGLVELTSTIMGIVGGGNTPTNFGEQHLCQSPDGNRRPKVLVGEPDGVHRRRPAASRASRRVPRVPRRQLLTRRHLPGRVGSPAKKPECLYRRPGAQAKWAKSQTQLSRAHP
jgi:hypothetical protein